MQPDGEIPAEGHESRCRLHPAWTHEEIRAVWQMQAVMKLLPSGNVTVTYQDGLRRAHHRPGNTHMRRTHTAAWHAGMLAVQSALGMHIQADLSEAVPADTFTCEPGCGGLGRDARRQV